MSSNHQSETKKPEPVEIEYTISQDRAAGQTAQEENGYKLLTGENSKQLGSASTRTARITGEELQVMLRERQEGRKQTLRLHEQRKRLEKPAELLRMLPGISPSTKRDRINLDDESSALLGDETGLLNTKRLKKADDGSRILGNANAPRDAGTGQATDQTISLGIGSPGAPRDANQGTCSSVDSSATTHAIRPAPGCIVLFRVVCSDGHDRCHSKTYLDEPHQVLIRGGYHLSGKTLIPDLGALLSNLDSINFIVYRDYYCGTVPRASFREQSSTRHLCEVVSIVSEHLHSTIQRISKFAPDRDSYPWVERSEQSVINDSVVLSTRPWEYSRRFLYHHRAEIDAEAGAAQEGSAITSLSRWLHENTDPMYEKCDSLFAQGVVTLETLPWLYYPNSLVVERRGSLEIAHVLWRFPIGAQRLTLPCWNWGYNGLQLRRKDSLLTVDISTYSKVKIQGLAVYPIDYASEETKQRLLDNGTKFWGLGKQSFVSYEGPDYMGERVYPPDSRCMIDYQVYLKFHGASSDAFAFSKKPKSSYDPWPMEIPNNARLEPSHLMLLPPGIHGFIMKEKKWVHLLVDLIRPVSWNKVAFDQLVLPKRTKRLIKGLVMIRKATSDSSGLQTGLRVESDDIIAGKGSGLIMLLHGGPGTGKTLTAESLAELAEMPLYSVTCGDIGISPDAVEKYLNSVLHLGRKWNCILLLDEADVFLEERSLSDLKRNSLVSVFLRTLEYYDGVLILTSNRVGAFDEAFKSRIQLALHYNPLDAPSRRKIWHNFLEILRADGENVDFDDIIAHIEQLSGYELNGRQIRNALTTARQLALYEQEKLDWDRVQDSIEVTSNFERYLKEVHGHTDEEWNRENKLR